ncbi:MAG TPA: ABC-F family ATP-binding cassette domain-containing protein [Anaerolineae bacterium]|nr:ABC-F family ATP-binding cassette domain-containing protein [Anaerolineae bacterium]
MLSVSNVAKSFGDNLLFEKVSFTVNRGECAGLVGPNGCGKTTLLKIILGEVKPDAGSVRLSPGDARAGYLAQALEYTAGQTVGDVLKAAVAGLAEAERRLERAAERMASASGNGLERLMAEYDAALEAFERLGGYRQQARGDEVLDGLELRHLDQETPVDILSGGQKTRLGLARLLLTNPDLLLLDEPTNHLDIDALEWLESYLDGFQGAVMIVSHDRALLDRTVDSILDLDPLVRTVAEYPGSYSAYVEVKERAWERQRAAYQDQQEFIARMRGTIAARKDYAKSIELGTIDFGPRKIARGIARKAVIQQRRLERLLDSDERIDRPERSWQIRLEFGAAPPTGRDVLHLEEVSMGFGDHVLFEDVNLTLRAGERRALIGPNGSGKTTLARLVQGELEPTAGRVRLGAGVRLGYYAQEQENLDPESTPYETIRAVAAMDQTEARSFLHYFLFAGDEVFHPVGSLSFGERARLALARLVAQGCSFLLLDEPINHLDIPSRTLFEQALTAFEGTILAIVHDRYFIERFATGVWSVEQNTIRAYPDLRSVRRREA